MVRAKSTEQSSCVPHGRRGVFLRRAGAPARDLCVGCRLSLAFAVASETGGGWGGGRRGDGFVGLRRQRIRAGIRAIIVVAWAIDRRETDLTEPDRDHGERVGY